MMAGSWDAMTLGELLAGLGLLGGGAGTAWLASAAARALGAGVRALDMWGRYLDASTMAARAQARNAPLQAAALRAQIKANGGTPPPDPEDSDELRVLRVVAEGDDAALAGLVEELATSDPESTLNRKLSDAERRLVAAVREVRRQRAAKDDVPRKREKSRSWLRKAAG